MHHFSAFAVAAALAAAACLPSGVLAGGLEAVATLPGRGTVDATIVARTPAGERIYQIFEYATDFDLVETDPTSGAHRVFHNGLHEGGGTLALGSDGKIYVGTHPGGHVLRFDPGSSQFTDLGRLGTEQYVWSLEPDRAGHIYAGTFPGGKLFRIDERAGSVDDLGRVAPAQDEYARTLALSDDGRTLYVGVGSVRADVVAVDLGTRATHSLMGGASSAGVADLYRASDGAIFAKVGAATYAVTAGGATRVAAPPAPRSPTLADGRKVTPTNDGLMLAGADGAHDIPSTYRGERLEAFRLTAGPDGHVYASTILPAYLERLDPGGGDAATLGYIGGGEVYSFEVSGPELFMGMYYGKVQTPILAFDTRRAYDASNPKLLHFAGEDPSWRPLASARAPDGNVYFGSQPGYGALGGHLVDVDANASAASDLGIPVAGQSITSLAAWHGTLVGGTSDLAGVGAVASNADAVVFLFDPASRRTTFQAVPIPGAQRMTDFVVRGDTLYGLANTEIFAYDLAKRKVLYSTRFAVGNPLSNCAGFGPDGAIWGASSSGIFRIDPATGNVTLAAAAQSPLSIGFAIVGNDIYVASRTTILRYRIGS
jgi:streptogramin lyase